MLSIPKMITSCVTILTVALLNLSISAQEPTQKTDAEVLYERGVSLFESEDETQFAEGFTCFRDAAEQGLDVAQFKLGECYKYGVGVDKDEAEAVKWYRLAAEQGLASAQNNLGFCYLNGMGVEQDAMEAVKWYRLAAEQGLALAQNNLGRCYETGNGVE